MTDRTEDKDSGIAVVQRLYEAFVQGDASLIMEQLHESLEWNESDNFMLAEGNPYRTPQAVADGVFRRLATEIQDYQATPTEIFNAGAVVVAIGRSKGTMVATGKPFDAQYAHIWRVRDGKIIGFRQIIDTHEIWRAQQAS